MTAAVLRRTPAPSGLRPVDSRRDLAGLADVMEAAFGDRLDDSGARMVKAMRAFGRWGWLGWAAGHLFLPPAAYPSGFVWIEDGRLVGNASLMPADLGSRRWVLINVAVAPTWRRKGIARNLVQACLDQARRLGAEEVVLQVDADNRGAQDLYESLGFLRTTIRSTWSRRIGSTFGSVDDPAARPRRPEDMAPQLALARRLCPEGLAWPRSLDGLELSLPAPWGRTAHWVWPKEGAIRGFLVTFPGYESPGVHALLVVEPEVSGQAEGPLLEAALRQLPPRYGEIQVETIDEAGAEALRLRGFRRERRLTWMVARLAVSVTVAPGARLEGGLEDSERRSV
jgi:ribosomal protein S18 acetylase RimI-like enzyme